jgi:cytochrome c oxidase subunit 2
MGFVVVVQERDDFAQWLAQQASHASTPTDPRASRGAEAFVANGCSACHAVRGTAADGVIGPDLTHVGGRLSLGAGVLGNDADEFLEWLSRTGEIKPGVHMPAFGMLPAEELVALAAYLEALK